ncbi:hypothetical protein PR048_026531 [Dryococelus australis]|uniref:Uncharacterized protein n=1 Tax=Dryococelus australis TaxID=614101 RepID=A0ABQ9GLM7_9NEOP|nr:hypothetical protein PR048_026531 [Dryococelus australis]
MRNCSEAMPDLRIRDDICSRLNRCRRPIHGVSRHSSDEFTAVFLRHVLTADRMRISGARSLSNTTLMKAASDVDIDVGLADDKQILVECCVPSVVALPTRNWGEKASQTLPPAHNENNLPTQARQFPRRDPQENTTLPAWRRVWRHGKDSSAQPLGARYCRLKLCCTVTTDLNFMSHRTHCAFCCTVDISLEGSAQMPDGALAPATISRFLGGFPPPFLPGAAPDFTLVGSQDVFTRIIIRKCESSVCEPGMRELQYICYSTTTTSFIQQREKLYYFINNCYKLVSGCSILQDSLVIGFPMLLYLRGLLSTCLSATSSPHERIKAIPVGQASTRANEGAWWPAISSRDVAEQRVSGKRCMACSAHGLRASWSGFIINEKYNLPSPTVTAHSLIRHRAGWTYPAAPDTSSPQPTIRADRLLGYHLGEPGSIPGRVTPGFSQVGIVIDGAAGRRVFSGISRSPALFIPALLHAPFTSSSSTLKTSIGLSPWRYGLDSPRRHHAQFTVRERREVLSGCSHLHRPRIPWPLQPWSCTPCADATTHLYLRCTCRLLDATPIGSVLEWNGVFTATHRLEEPTGVSFIYLLRRPSSPNKGRAHSFGKAGPWEILPPLPPWDHPKSIEIHMIGRLKRVRRAHCRCSKGWVVQFSWKGGGEGLGESFSARAACRKKP